MSLVTQKVYDETAQTTKDDPDIAEAYSQTIIYNQGGAPEQ